MRALIAANTSEGFQGERPSRASQCAKPLDGSVDTAWGGEARGADQRVERASSHRKARPLQNAHVLDYAEFFRSVSFAATPFLWFTVQQISPSDSLQPPGASPSTFHSVAFAGMRHNQAAAARSVSPLGSAQWNQVKHQWGHDGTAQAHVI